MLLLQKVVSAFKFQRRWRIRGRSRREGKERGDPLSVCVGIHYSPMPSKIECERDPSTTTCWTWAEWPAAPPQHANQYEVECISQSNWLIIWHQLNSPRYSSGRVILCKLGRRHRLAQPFLRRLKESALDRSMINAALDAPSTAKKTGNRWRP